MKPHKLCKNFQIFYEFRSSMGLSHFLFQAFLPLFFAFQFFSLTLLSPAFSSKNRISKKETQKSRLNFTLTYNDQVQKWLNYFQKQGREKMKRWLNLSPLFVPSIQKTFKKKSIPKELAYLSLIESGLSAHAISSANAVGYWQFISSTARRYGLKTNWWLDERRDFIKSTYAAASYLNDLYNLFRSWDLAASAYNMGENRLMKLIEKHKTRHFWTLCQKKDFPRETKEYIPKFMATLLISKNPHKYGFKDKDNKDLKTTYIYEMNYEYLLVPGGTDLYLLALHMNMPVSKIKNLNPEIHLGFVPLHIKEHMMRIPKQSKRKVAFYIQKQFEKQRSFQGPEAKPEANSL